MDVEIRNVNRSRCYIVGDQFVSHRGQRQVGVVAVDEWRGGSLGGHPLFVTSTPGSTNNGSVIFFFFLNKVIQQ